MRHRIFSIIFILFFIFVCLISCDSNKSNIDQNKDGQPRDNIKTKGESAKEDGNNVKSDNDENGSKNNDAEMYEEEEYEYVSVEDIVGKNSVAPNNTKIKDSDFEVDPADISKTISDDWVSTNYKINNEMVLINSKGEEYNITSLSGLITEPNIAVLVPFGFEGDFVKEKVEILKETYSKCYPSIKLIMFISGKVSSRELRGFVNENGIPFPVLIDQSGKFIFSLNQDNKYDDDNIFVMGINRKIRYILPINKLTLKQKETIYKDINKIYLNLKDKPLQKKPLEKNTADFIIMANPLGEISVCECPSQLYGGLSRYAYILDEYRREYNAEPVSIIAGNNFNEASQPDYHNYFLQACQKLSLSAMIPGVTDFIESYKYLSLFTKNLPYTALNVNDEYLSLPRYQIVESNGLKIGIIGLVPRKVITDYAYFPSDFLSEDNIKLLSDTIAEIKNDTDVIVLSAHPDNYRVIEQIVNNVPEIDLVIRTASSNVSDLESVNFYKKPLIEMGNDGYYAVRARIKKEQDKVKVVEIDKYKLDGKVNEHQDIIKYLKLYQKDFGM